MKPSVHGRVIVLLALVLAGCQSAPAIEYDVHTNYSVADPQFARTMGSLLGPPLVGGNQVTALRNGVEIFPAMLSAIRSARKTITLETYIYWSGDIGSKMTAALAERARAGVQVRVIMDWLGSDRIDHHFIDQMRDAGIQFVEYHPVKWYDPWTLDRLNNRTHRKILVIDGRIGFTGGVGIADLWLGNADAPNHWRDMQYRVEGPVVAQLQSAFLDNWMKTTGQVLDGADYFPPLSPRGTEYCQMFKSGPEGGSENMELLYLMSVAATRKSLLIGDAYFVPGTQFSRALIAAQRRGVKVQIIVPGKYLEPEIVRPASRSTWGELLKVGIEIYEYQPTMYHTKLLIADGVWVSVGSSNLDNRSFRLNDESNLNFLDAGLAEQLTKVFEDDLKHSKRLSYERWKDRPLSKKILEALTSIIKPLL